MLPEDELDFEDFGDLGEVEGPELTNEELEALEQEFRSENASALTELEEVGQEKKPTSASTPASAPATTKRTTTTTKATTTTATDKQKEDETTVNNNLEEGETPNDDKAEPNQPEQQRRQANFSSNQQQHQKVNNNMYKNNAYNQHGFYGHQSMPMNNMFPPYPQFSNRIYVNPKFNKGAASQQMQLQQQQQRQFMEMEAQRMLLMQRQMQLQQQEQQRLAELEKQRREIAENMRKRREQKNSEAGEKRPRPVETDDNNDNQQNKRQEKFAPSPAGGITIKGVAAARNNNLSPRNTPYQPSNERKPSSPYDRKISTVHDRNPPKQYEKPSITSRLGKPGNPAANSATTPNKNSLVSIASTPIVPIVTNGKSNTLVISGLSKDTKEKDIQNMTNGINGGAQDIRLNLDANSAIVVFPTVESAVTFRRKYNRIQMGESHITISFQK